MRNPASFSFIKIELLIFIKYMNYSQIGFVCKLKPLIYVERIIQKKIVNTLEI